MKTGGLLARLHPELVRQPVVAYPARLAQPVVVEPRLPTWVQRAKDNELKAKELAA